MKTKRELWYARIGKGISGPRLAFIRKSHEKEIRFWELSKHMKERLGLDTPGMAKLQFTNEEVDSLQPGDWIGDAAIITLRRDKWGRCMLLLSIKQEAETPLFHSFG